MDAVGGSEGHGARLSPPGVIGGGLCVALAAVGISCASPVQAQDVTTLPQAATPLGAQDACYVVQSGISKQFPCTSLASSIASGFVSCTTILSGSGDLAFSGQLCSVLSTTLTSVTSGGTFTKITFDSKGRVLSGTNISGADLPLQNGGVMYPLGDNGGVITSGLYTAIGGFPWSSGNITSMYGGIAGGGASMTMTLYSATSSGAALSAVAGCSAIAFSAGGGVGTPITCVATPILRNGQIFCSVSTVTSAASNGFCQPGFNRTGT